jgi:hypothetical protein
MPHQQHCYCAKCQGCLVSERTERAHRNGPAFCQLEAASRKPSRQNRAKVDTATPGFEPPLSSNQQPQTSRTSHSDVIGDRYAEAERSVTISFLLVTESD